MGALDYLGSVKTPTRQIAAEVHQHLEKIGKPLPVYRDMGSQVIWGYNSGGAEHGTGRALDFMVQSPSNGVGDAIADYVWANRDRFGLIHIIWKQRIKSTRTNPGQWRGMANRGSPTENHMDHPHCFFDGRAIKGTPSSGGGSSSEWVPTGDYSTKEIQEIVGVKADGKYGDGTKAAVKELQQAIGATQDGLWGRETERIVASLIEKIDSIAKDVKEVKTDLGKVPARVWTHQIDTPKSVLNTYPWFNKKFTTGGAQMYNLFSFGSKDDTDKIIRAIKDDQ